MRKKALAWCVVLFATLWMFTADIWPQCLMFILLGIAMLGERSSSGNNP